MIDPDLLYASCRIEGSYFSKMLHCGENYNRWVEIALQYLPQDIFIECRDKLAFYSTGHVDACRVARRICEEREIILLSERILPKAGAKEDQSNARYFIFAVLHEVAHAVKQHRSPLYDNLTKKEKLAQEKEATELALRWFNDHVKIRNNPNLKPITIEEIKEVELKNQELMEKLHEGRK